jgi:hypothetical protein
MKILIDECLPSELKETLTPIGYAEVCAKGGNQQRS